MSQTDLTLYRTAEPIAALVLGHGAGAGQKSAWMQNVARGFQDRGISTATFDFPYMAAKKGVPDKPPVLEAAWTGAIDAAVTAFPGIPLFIGGKSMGGRIASHIAAKHDPRVAGLVLLGYPLHPPGKPEQRRDAHLPDIAVPTLFVQGSRDTFGTAADIRSVLRRMKEATLHEVNGGDHSFKVPGGASKQQPALEAVLDVVSSWIRDRVKNLP